MDNPSELKKNKNALSSFCYFIDDRNRYFKSYFFMSKAIHGTRIRAQSFEIVMILSFFFFFSCIHSQAFNISKNFNIDPGTEIILRKR